MNQGMLMDTFAGQHRKDYSGMSTSSPMPIISFDSQTALDLLSWGSRQGTLSQLS
jgi:hypothetical protein